MAPERIPGLSLNKSQWRQQMCSLEVERLSLAEADKAPAPPLSAQ